LNPKLRIKGLKKEKEIRKTSFWAQLPHPIPNLLARPIWPLTSAQPVSPSATRIGPKLDAAPAGLCGWGHRVSVAVVIFPMRIRLRGARDTDANRGGFVAALGPNPQCPSQLNTCPLSLPVGPRRRASPLPSPLSSDRLNSWRAARESL
jgi:hypothetical protein